MDDWGSEKAACTHAHEPVPTSIRFEKQKMEFAQLYKYDYKCQPLCAQIISIHTAAQRLMPLSLSMWWIWKLKAPPLIFFYKLRHVTAPLSDTKRKQQAVLNLCICRKCDGAPYAGARCLPPSLSISVQHEPPTESATISAPPSFIFRLTFIPCHTSSYFQAAS